MPTAGQIIRASDVTQRACRVTHNASQSIANNTLTVVAFNTEELDTDTMHDVSTNNSRITIQTAGTYVVGFNGVFASGSYSHTRCVLRVNGTTDIATFRTPGVAGVEQHVMASTIYPLVVGDYIEVQVAQVNTVPEARNLTAQADNSPEFWAAKILA